MTGPGISCALFPLYILPLYILPHILHRFPVPVTAAKGGIGLIWKRWTVMGFKAAYCLKRATASPLPETKPGSSWSGSSQKRLSGVTFTMGIAFVSKTLPKGITGAGRMITGIYTRQCQDRGKNRPDTAAITLRRGRWISAHTRSLMGTIRL